MHCAALTYDNKFLTWGVSKLGALRRHTTQDGGMVMQTGSDSEDSASGMSPQEATPAAIDISVLPENTTFALNNRRTVYDWRTFKVR